MPRLTVKAVNDRIDESAQLAKRIIRALKWLQNAILDHQRRLDEIETALGIEELTRQED